ncbi:MAG: hypothetical protein DWQ47_07200 [Acidobacteria bacterium]|nr:MAG: hypothetical protein DWQ32_15300 [Acidobacteriota bacterium]REJ99288.1 MAG: hypothetical protein DWQ38_14675 [Acidobacteriota bacterium]REK15991.1 MAG: hypothetical protein DWQ43_03010 [Acidobacteriota bacterium]REK43672.1 MAG: hypothetical protein DWQ47_07200 [Acidobacteriota bacterium]
MRGKSLFLFVIFSTAFIGVLVWLDPGNAFAQRSLKRETVASVSEQRQQAVSDQIARLIQSSGLSVDRHVLLPERHETAKTLELRIGQETRNPIYYDQLEQAPEISVDFVSGDERSVRRQRSFELADHQLVIFLTDAENRVLWWDIVSDPRILRAESSNDTGELSGKTLYRTTGQVVIGVPAVDAVETLHVFKPVWDGQSFRLDPLGDVNVSK